MKSESDKGGSAKSIVVTSILRCPKKGVSADEADARTEKMFACQRVNLRGSEKDIREYINAQEHRQGT